jgi:hypothetical protein
MKKNINEHHSTIFGWANQMDTNSRNPNNDWTMTIGIHGLYLLSWFCLENHRHDILDIWGIRGSPCVPSLATLDVLLRTRRVWHSGKPSFSICFCIWFQTDFGDISLAMFFAYFLIFVFTVFTLTRFWQSWVSSFLDKLLIIVAFLGELFTDETVADWTQLLKLTKCHFIKHINI